MAFAKLVKLSVINSFLACNIFQPIRVKVVCFRASQNLLLLGHVTFPALSSRLQIMCRLFEAVILNYIKLEAAKYETRDVVRFCRCLPFFTLRDH